VRGFFAGVEIRVLFDVGAAVTVWSVTAGREPLAPD
jgi:hypothetical protein